MKSAPTIEQLEPRIAPAALAGQVLSYTDTDGDHVTLTISKGTLNPMVFSFDTGTVDGTTTTPQHLVLINLAGTPDATGASISMKVTRAGNGDGLADVDHIIATGLNLGAVSIAGDLLEIDAGHGDAGINAIASLKVRSFGEYADPASGGGVLTSSINGTLGSLTTKGDFQFVKLDVTGKIGNVTIGGTLRGGAVADAGSITSSSDIGAVKITGSLLGGSASGTGSITADGNITSLTVKGSVIGVGTNSAQITALGIGPINVSGDWLGGGDNSANLSASAEVTSFTLGGSMLGGAGQASGVIGAVGKIGAVKIGHDFVGGTGAGAGSLGSNATIASISIGGSVVGGSAIGAGLLHPNGGTGSVKIGGDLVGGTALQTGSIIASTGTIATNAVTIGGSVLGGAGAKSGYIELHGSGSVKVGHDLRGGAGQHSAEIFITTITSAKVGGSIIGGGSDFAGSIISSETLGTTTIGGDVRGGAGLDSGQVSSDNGGIKSLTIGGSLVGGDGVSSGLVFAPGDIGKVTIKHDLRGSTNAATTDGGEILSDGGSIAGVSIGGSATGGPGAFSGSILANNLLGAVSVKGDIRGFAADKPFTLRGGGTHSGTDFAITSLTVGGSVTDALVLGGFGFNNTTLDPSVQIGPVKVGRDWIASSITAGVKDTLGNGYGTSDDAPISLVLGAGPVQKSKIASITIGGVVSGTFASGDNFGFDAEQFGPIKISGSTKTPAGTPVLVAPVTKDVFIFKAP